MTRLLIRPGAIGDFIVSIPAMESLRDGYLEVWCAEPNVPLARFGGTALSIASTGLDLLGLPDLPPPASLLARLCKFDSIVSWYGTNRPEFRDAVNRLGLPFHFFQALPSGAGEMHATDFYREQARSLSPSHEAPSDPHIDCEAAREGFAVIHPFAGSTQKRWPFPQFQQVAETLSERMPVHWCAGPEEPLDGAVRIPNLYDLASWLAKARVYIGNDSGIAHLAAAVRTPVVVLFGPSDPRVWAPRGGRVTVLRPMDAIDARAVLAVVDGISSRD